MATSKKNQSKPEPPATVQDFPIVGIGASAGGLDAFKRLLTAIPENSGMAYVLVQHLNPSHESILPEILQRVTTIPVLEITDDIHLAPDHIYVIPSSKMLFSTDGVLRLIERENKVLNLSIDIFFTSLAEVHKEFAVGVVLSGTGSDGTLGLKAIKEHGGISMVQDSESAAYDSMPQSALNAGVVDFVLAPEKIPQQLLEIKGTYKTNHFFKEPDEMPKDDEGVFKQILLLLRQRSGVDFSYYKQPTFHRRIARRIAIVKKKNLADYLKFLRTNKAEQDALFQDVLIPVTSFFRDPKTFLTLIETVFPTILKNKAADEAIRIWIAGCSTGEEAYSIAICLHEFLGDKSAHPRIQIFASDISDKAIKKARAAIYTKAEVEGLSETQLKNYFRKNNGDYEVNKLIRDMCVFAPHNFLKDPPFAKMDLISCRNVLIYMDTFLQKKAFTTFHYALKENSFLLLGKSETTGVSSDLFTQVSKHDKIYSRKPLPGRFMHVATERREELLATNDKTVTKHETVHVDFRKSAEEIMISKSPASVIVNEQMDIVHVHGDITPFLQAPQGKPTHNLIKMAREGLAFELRNAIHKATKEQAPVTKENIPIKATEKQTLVSIEIIPLTDTIELHYLIRFEKKIIPIVQEEKKSSSGKIIETRKQNEQLEKELLHTREDMRSITEDMEAANEELQSANEELQSSNEEMQSLNEELETSKEELQSTNEELIIVNQELLDKQEQLNVSHALQLEAHKRIEESEKEQKKLASQLKLATDSAKVGIWSLDIKTAKLEWSGLMKKMWGYSENLDNLTFEDWSKLILPEDRELTFKTIEESKNNHSIYDAEYRIKRANDGTIAWMKSTGKHQYDDFGEAITLTGINLDITEQKEALGKLKANAIELATKNKQIEESETFNRTILNSSPDCLKVLDGEGRIQYMNLSGLCQMEIDDFSIIKNKYWWTLWGCENEALVKSSVDKAMKGETAHFIALCATAKGTDKWWDVIISPVGKVGEKVKQIISVSRDITKQKEGEEKIRQSEELFKSIFDNSLAAIVVTNDQGNYLSANKAASELFGYSIKELLQMNVADLKTNEKHRAIERFEQYISKGEETGEFDFTAKNDEHKFVQYQATRIKADFHLSIMMDITKQKLIDKLLEEAKSKAEIAKEIAENATIAKQQFLSNMSHEIRTPMNAIIGFTKVMMKTGLTEKQKEHLQAINSSGQTLIVLIDDILDLAKVDAGKMIFINSPFKMLESINTILHLFETKIQERNLELVKEYDSRIPEIVLGDSIRLHQILINLIGNAIKFTAKGKIMVSVNLLKEDEEKVTLEIKVADTGIGIPQNKMTSIFENFEQAQTNISSLYGGTGLGLAIVKQLVEKQGGTISVISKVDEGSTFSFILSFEKTTASIVLENETGHYETKIRPLKVLVVEDVKLNQLLMKIILEDFKFDYDIADNGQIAVEKLQVNSYDIILMDLQMPVMNGFEATEYIRNKMNLQIPIIALTADVTTVDVNKCRIVGMNDYISKPIDEKLLYSKILDAIKSK
jgi:two-component system CheB/CheR fusion protein